ncbi:MAG: hypothetical protein H7145_08125 [Akkermansiaceae bacterium]|nr:hypothetical protein [Armatimonadota bacterium]
MTSNTFLSRRVLAGFLAAFALTAGAVAPAFAHEAPCPFCKVKITQDTPTQDNETVLRLGRKRIEYKCVYCALTEANTKYRASDVTILAPSDKKGAPVEITRKGGTWNAPEGTVFVAVKASHRICQETYRAFTSKAGYDAYVAKNKAKLPDAKPLTLTEMVAVAAK